MTEYEVEFISQARLAKAQTIKHKEWIYHVKWVGYGMEHNTWEPERNFKKFSGNMIDQFWTEVDLGGRDRTDFSQFKVIGEEFLPTLRPPKNKKCKISEATSPAPMSKVPRIDKKDIAAPMPSSSTDKGSQTALAPLPSLEMLTKKVKAVSRFAFNPVLHNAIGFMDDDVDLERFIRLSHSADPDCIDRPDTNGFTPLDVAMLCINLTALRVLLDLGVDLSPLRSRDSDDRVAPLVLLQEKITRERQDPPLVAFFLKSYRGSLADQEEMEALVKEVMGNYPTPNCSCGSCDEGWLSPKMRARLQVTAAKISADMLLRINTFPAPPRQALTAEQADQDPYMKYMPLEGRQKAFLAFYRGYEEIVDIIRRVLAREVAFSIPASEDIRLFIQRLPGRHYAGISDAQFFLNKGCHVDHVLDCVVDFAEKERINEDQAWMERTAIMPDCPNDLKFDLVRKKLGFWGNY